LPPPPNLIAVAGNGGDLDENFLAPWRFSQRQAIGELQKEIKEFQYLKLELQSLSSDDWLISFLQYVNKRSSDVETNRDNYRSLETYLIGSLKQKIDELFESEQRPAFERKWKFDLVSQILGPLKEKRLYGSDVTVREALIGKSLVSTSAAMTIGDNETTNSVLNFSDFTEMNFTDQSEIQNNSSCRNCWPETHRYGGGVRSCGHCQLKEKIKTVHNNLFAVQENTIYNETVRVLTSLVNGLKKLHNDEKGKERQWMLSIPHDAVNIVWDNVLAPGRFPKCRVQFVEDGKLSNPLTFRHVLENYWSGNKPPLRTLESFPDGPQLKKFLEILEATEELRQSAREIASLVNKAELAHQTLLGKCDEIISAKKTLTLPLSSTAQLDLYEVDYFDVVPKFNETKLQLAVSEMELKEVSVS